MLLRVVFTNSTCIYAPNNAARYCEAKASQRLLEALHEGLCLGWRRSIGKARTATPARIGVKGELRDDQRLAADVEQFSILVEP